MISGLFSFSGCTGRLGYVGYMTLLVILWVVFFIVAAMTATALGGNVFLVICFVLVGVFLLLIPPMAITARRLHDIGLSGWWQFLPLALNIAIGIALYFYAFSEIDFENIKVLAEQQESGEPSETAIQEELLSELPLDRVRGASYLMTFSSLFGLGFGIFLLFWPGNEYDNPYREEDAYAAALERRVAPQVSSSGYENTVPEDKYVVVLKESMPKESLYVFSGIKADNPQIKNINLPSKRDRIEIITSVQTLDIEKIKSILKSYDIQFASVKKTK